MGLHMAGFEEIVGVDLRPQQNYPFTFAQGDAMEFADFDEFDFIWASPPCQAYSRAQRIRDRTHPDLIGRLRERLRASGKPWVIENVPGAPLLHPVELCGAMFPGLRVYRHRLFECSFYVKEPNHPEHVAPLRKMGRRVLDGEFMHVVGNFTGAELAREAMGISWMTRDELSEAIPPAYSEFIARSAYAKSSPARSDALVSQPVQGARPDLHRAASCPVHGLLEACECQAEAA